MIIGVTGEYGAGKDMVAEILVEKGFSHISLSDFLREELRKRGKEITRENLIALGNKLRQGKGGDILARKAVEQMKPGKEYVVTSFRNVKEVEYFQQWKNFVLIRVTAPEKIRLQRLIARHRERDPATLPELRQREQQENRAGEAEMNLSKVAAMAEYELVNDASEKRLRQKVEELLQITATDR